jgi:hypothetical protein
MAEGGLAWAAYDPLPFLARHALHSRPSSTFFRTVRQASSANSRNTNARSWAGEVTGWPFDQRRNDYLRLLRQAPAISEIGYLDSSGHKQLKVSRLAMNALPQR